MTNHKHHAKKRHINIEEAPKWTIDNGYIKTGYRQHDPSFFGSMKTAFSIHNETFNIWTHFFGALFFIILCFFISSILTKGAHPSRLSESPLFKQTVENHRRELKAILPESNHEIPKAKNKITEILAKIEQNLSDFPHKLSELVHHEKDFLVGKINKNSKFMLKKLKNLLNWHVTSDFDISHYIEKTHHFFENCLKKFHLDFLNDLSPKHLEHYPVFVFLFGAISCLSFSTIYHLFQILDPKISKILHKLDYAGIALLNFGSSYAVFFYYFYCDIVSFYIATGFIFTACACVFIVSLTDWIDAAEQTTFKGLMYGFLGISNVIPAMFILYLIYHSSDDNDHLGLGVEFLLIVLMAVTYLSGLVFYIRKIPERWTPYKFDIYFNSHTIWHIFVFAAALEHLFALWFLYDKRYKNHCLHC